MSRQVGTGPEGLVVPGDLEDRIEDEAAALGNGEDIPEESAPEPPAAGNGKAAADDGQPAPAATATGVDVPEERPRRRMRRRRSRRGAERPAPAATATGEETPEESAPEPAAAENGAAVANNGQPAPAATATGEEIPEESTPAPAAAGNGKTVADDGQPVPNATATGEDVPEENAPVPAAAGTGEAAADDGEPGPAAGKTGDNRDWTAIDRHADRVAEAWSNALLRTAAGVEANVGKLLSESDEKLQRRIGELLKASDTNVNGKFHDMKLYVTGSVGVAGREQVAAVWRGPAEALLLLGGALNGIVERAGLDLVEDNELRKLLPVLRTAEELLQRACQHEEGKLPVIDEELGTTGTHGARVEAVCRMVGEAATLAERMLRGTESSGRKAIAIGVAGCVVGLAGVFGAEGGNSEFVQRVERLRQERAGPVEAAESNEVRAFRADFGKEVERLRSAMRWRERGIWAAGLAVSLLLGWGVGMSGVDFSSVGRLL